MSINEDSLPPENIKTPGKKEGKVGERGGRRGKERGTESCRFGCIKA